MASGQPVGEHRQLPVPSGLEGMRLDQAISRLFGLSRSVAAGMIEAGDVVVDGAVRGKSDRVVAGSWLEVVMPAPPAPAGGGPLEAVLEVPDLRVQYSDSDLVVIEKPVGVAAHASPGWTGPTVTAGLAALGQPIATGGAAERQGIVHRLDVGTSGLMVVAKSERAYSALKRAFKAREVDKRYRAVVQGHPDPLRGTIDAPIDRHPTQDYKFAVVSGGRPSVTHYDTLEAFPGASLLDIHLETGRTHQIRVHFAAFRHPCVGDLTYGADPVLAERLQLTRQWLHAFRLGFVHPGTGEYVQFESEYPSDLGEALAILRQGN